MASREIKAYKRLKGIRGDDLPYIFESNPHPNLIHTQFLAIS
jgi:hypothetical protein